VVGLCSTVSQLFVFLQNIKNTRKFKLIVNYNRYNTVIEARANRSEGRLGSRAAMVSWNIYISRGARLRASGNFLGGKIDRVPDEWLAFAFLSIKKML
jgi:hypothetical protein